MIRRIYEPFIVPTVVDTDPDGDASAKRITGNHAWVADELSGTMSISILQQFGGLRITTNGAARITLGELANFGFDLDQVDALRMRLSLFSVADVDMAAGLLQNVAYPSSSPGIGFKFQDSVDDAVAAYSVDDASSETAITSAPTLVATEVIDYELVRQTQGSSSGWDAFITREAEARKRYLGSFAAADVSSSNNMKLGVYVNATAGTKSVDLHSIEVLSQQL